MRCEVSASMLGLLVVLSGCAAMGHKNVQIHRSNGWMAKFFNDNSCVIFNEDLKISTYAIGETDQDAQLRMSLTQLNYGDEKTPFGFHFPDMEKDKFIILYKAPTLGEYSLDLFMSNETIELVKFGKGTTSEDKKQIVFKPVKDERDTKSLTGFHVLQPLCDEYTATDIRLSGYGNFENNLKGAYAQEGAVRAH